MGYIWFSVVCAAIVAAYVLGYADGVRWPHHWEREDMIMTNASLRQIRILALSLEKLRDSMNDYDVDRMDVVRAYSILAHLVERYRGYLPQDSQYDHLPPTKVPRGDGWDSGGARQIFKK